MPIMGYLRCYDTEELWTIVLNWDFLLTIITDKFGPLNQNVCLLTDNLATGNLYEILYIQGVIIM